MRRNNILYTVHYMSRNTMKKKFSLKDELFNKGKVEYLAGLLTQADSQFKKEAFTEEVMSKLLTLELKERIVWIAEVLENYVSKDYKKASEFIIKALPEPLDPSKTDNDFGSFIFAPLGEYVVRNGLQKELLPYSFATLLEITQRFSMEDAMRPFINAYTTPTFIVLEKWSTHKHYLVRRLVSETTRPLLPWSRRIVIDVTKPIPLLNTLHADKTRFVTRSVANHLNDISKKEPTVVIDLLKKWKKEGKQDDAELEWMTRHALRTLVKQGNKEALELLGYKNEPQIIVEQFSLKSTSKKITSDGTLSFSFTIFAKENCELMIDYVIDFVKAKGYTKPKVFKIKKVKLNKGEHVSIIKNHRFVVDATTYKLYGGKHTVTLQINGSKFNSADFTVVQ